MFFPLSKILGFFAIPSNLVISIGLLGLLLLPTRFARAGRALAFASLILLAILGLSPVGNALIILLEDRSRNTVENAIFSKALVQPKPGERWLLVTSGHHMPRAIGVFRKMGFPVEPYPVDWRTRGASDAR